MTTPKRSRRGRTTMAAAGLDPVSAAKSRISTCERYGMAVDPRDEEILTTPHDVVGRSSICACGKPDTDPVHDVR